jgi:hypothetical protein
MTTTRFFETRDAFGISRARHIGFALAGAAVGATLCGVVLALFATASPPRWLPASADAVALVEACQQRPQRLAREACVRKVLAQWQANERGEVSVATQR